MHRYSGRLLFYTHHVRKKMTTGGSKVSRQENIIASIPIAKMGSAREYDFPASSTPSKCADCHQRNRCPLSPIDKISQIIHKLPLTESTYEASSTIAQENSKLSKIMVVKSGSLLLSNRGSEESIHVQGFTFPNAILVPESIETGKLDLTITALEKTRICEIERIELLYALRLSVNFFQLFLRAIADQSASEKTYMMKLRRGSVDARTAGFLLQLSKRYNAGNNTSKDIILSMSRSDISSYLDITTESLSRCLSRLSKSNVISVFNRRISILDIESLKSIAGN